TKLRQAVRLPVESRVGPVALERDQAIELRERAIELAVLDEIAGAFVQVVRTIVERGRPIAGDLGGLQLLGDSLEVDAVQLEIDAVQRVGRGLELRLRLQLELLAVDEAKFLRWRRLGQRGRGHARNEEESDDEVSDVHNSQ